MVALHSRVSVRLRLIRPPVSDHAPQAAPGQLPRLTAATFSCRACVEDAPPGAPDARIDTFMSSVTFTPETRKRSIDRHSCDECNLSSACTGIMPGAALAFPYLRKSHANCSCQPALRAKGPGVV